jgi:hypothetical protein
MNIYEFHNTSQLNWTKFSPSLSPLVRLLYYKDLLAFCVSYCPSCVPFPFCWKRPPSLVRVSQ